MINNVYPYLRDTQFLKALSNEPILSCFVKIIFLDWQENPIKEIQQRILSGNINIDGQSSLRRTANLSFLLEEKSVEDLFFINKKIEIHIGYTNPTNKYTNFNILWFPQGIYVITDYSISHGLDGSTVSLSLQDKMCLLNGQCGGTLPAAVELDKYDTIDQKGNPITIKPTIYQIIKQLVNHFGGQPLNKIIISDLETRVKQVMQWTGTSPLYLLRKGSQYVYTTNSSEYRNYIQQGYADVDGSPFSTGDNVGFAYIDFTYPSELIANPGDSVVSMLQQIKETLGNYEFFYDINGNFVFRQIKNYLNNTHSKYILDSLNNNQLVPDYLSSSQQAYLLDRVDGKTIFNFDSTDGQSLIISYNNSPQISLIKNDFIVWGAKTTISGEEIPIRYHLAIDKKPQIGNTYKAFAYQEEDSDVIAWKIPIQYDTFSNFPSIGLEGLFYYDKQSGVIYKWGWKESDQAYTYVQVALDSTDLKNITTTDWRTQLYFQGMAAEPYGSDSNYYYAELLNEWPKIYEIKPDEQKDGKWVNESGFRSQFIKDPSLMEYYLDFIDTTSKVNRFSVSNIGRRTQVWNEGKDANCIFQAWIPDIILLPLDNSIQTSDIFKLREECEKKGQNYYQMTPSLYDNLMIGGFKNSCYQIIKQSIQNYLNYNDSVSIQTIPLYFLQPNNCIRIKDEQSGIQGNYLISSLSFSLGHDGTLNISAFKVLQKI